MEERRSEVNDAFDSPTFGKDGSFHVDKPVGSMSISPCGRDVVLASRQGLHIIDLDSPWTPPRHLRHLTPWEVADVQWSPFASRDYWVVSTSNQKALVWNLAMSTPSASIEHVLHAHTRAITDINFSAHHPDLLATCAVDAFVHCWDLRFPARPAMSFCDWFAGATQVKWNRQEGHIVASAHDKVLRIWDDRKGAHPLRSIVAHSTKIYGIDWNRADSRKLVTCSLDKTIKAWDYESETDEPERIVATAFPVWRARHTPFGQGLLAMPQRNDSNLHLYDGRPENACPPDHSMPCVKEFKGHHNHVKEFLWRARGSVDSESDQREWQLVTWGSDLYLRLHRMTDPDLELVGCRKGDPPAAKLLFTRRDAAYKTFREVPGKSSSPPLRPETGAANHNPDSGYELHQPWARPIIPPSSSALGGWMSGGFVNSRFGAGSRSVAQKDLDPITWMKGVKIGKTEPRMEQSLPSVASPNFRLDRNADEFESLGDEITHVGTKFSKVEFSRVDVQKRFLQLSLHGPWGPQHSMTYLNCRIEFPTDYPKQAHPLVTIEKTALLPDETIAKLQQDTKRLGAAFHAFHKPSFESLVMYLQGDQTLDDLIAWTKEDPEASLYDFAAPAEDSSSDDEDDLGAFVGKQESDLGMSGSGVLSVSNANVNVPLARTCGALWSYSGKLICFFKQRDESTQSLVGSFGLDDHSAFPKSKRRGYDGLGRFYPTSTIKSKTSSHGTMESDESDSDYSSDSSELSSSSSWLSTQDLDSKGRYLGGSNPMRSSISPFQGPERLAEEARRSNPSVSGTKSRSGTTKCLIVLRDLSNLLPAKPTLAESYKLTGPNACTANAAVARQHGSFDLAEAWVVIDMILKDTVPVKAVPLPELLESSKRAAPGDVVGIDATSSETADWQATVKWGNHPFGKSFLVEQLFDYFARIGDIQMLAAMSCIFYCPPPKLEASGVRDDPQVSARGKFRHALSDVLSSPSLASPNRVDYFPSMEVAVSVLNPELPLIAGGALIKRPTFEPTSLSSSLGTGEGSAFFPPAITPPTTSRFSRRSSDQPDSEPYPLSSSPERQKWAQRSSSQIASALSSSFNRPFFTASASSSPPNVVPKKKVSPIGSFGASQVQLAGTISSRAFSRSLSNVDEPRSVFESARTDRQRDDSGSKAQRTPRFQVRLKNQDEFFHDGYSDTSLLQVSEGWRYENWRALYANLLAAWGLPLQRAEVLKYNNKNASAEATQEVQTTETTGFTIGKRKPRENSLSGMVADIQVVSICSICGPTFSILQDNGARCMHQQQRRSSPLRCLLCEENIHGRASPCLNCGHVMHAACWDAAVALHSSTPYVCLSGCGCLCSEHVQVGGNRIETKAPPVSVTPSNIREAIDPARRETETSVPWDHVAYESLVKNLDNFRRTSKSTWRQKNRHGMAQDP